MNFYNPGFLSDPFLVNTEIYVSQRWARTAVGDDGTFGVVWWDNSGFYDSILYQSIRFQKFNSDLEKVGGEILLDEGWTGQKYNMQSKRCSDYSQ